MYMTCADAATGTSFTQEGILTLDVAKGKWIQQITININLPISIINLFIPFYLSFCCMHYIIP